MTPFEEILRRRRQRRYSDGDPGTGFDYGQTSRQPMDERFPDGSSVQDLLRSSLERSPSVIQRTQPTPAAPVLTGQNQQAIVRPRRVTPSQPVSPAPTEANRLGGYVPPGAHWEQWDKPNEYGDTGEYISGTPNRPTDNATGGTAYASSPDAQRQRAVTFNPQTGRPNEDYYRQRNDPMGLYNAYENWQPHGGKRGFKNSLKAGALTAARAAQMTDNPAAILTAFGVGAAGGAVNPDFKNKLVQGFKTEQLGSELTNRLKLQREQANINMAQLVPVTLDNGEQVLVPARTAAGLQSRQQEIGLRGDTLEARKKRWDALGEHEGARDAQALYNSGAADDSAELRAEIARRLRLPAGTVLPPRGLGNQIKIDDTGNYVVVNPRSGAVTDTGRGSFAATQEKGRNTRQQRAITAANQRVQIQQAGADRRAGSGGVKVDATTKRDIAKGYGEYSDFTDNLSAIDKKIQDANALPANWINPVNNKETKNEYLTRLGRQRARAVSEIKKRMAELNQLDPESEWGAGEGGYPYRKPREGVQQGQQSAQPTGQYAGRRISQANVAEYGRRHNMSAADAAAYLKNEGAIIY